MGMGYVANFADTIDQNAIKDLSYYVKDRVNNPNFYVNKVHIAKEDKLGTSGPSWDVVYATGVERDSRGTPIYYELSAKKVLGQDHLTGKTSWNNYINWDNVNDWVNALNSISQEDLKMFGKIGVSETWHFSPDRAKEIWWKNSHDPELQQKYKEWKQENAKNDVSTIHNPIGKTWGT